MQGLRVLRGCFTAYLAGVLAIGLVNALTSERGWDVIGVVALFGLFAMVPFTFAALAIWHGLARHATRISAVLAIAICGGVFAAVALVLALANGSVLVGLVAPLGAFVIGSLFGVAFWLGAFGKRRDVVLTRGKG